MDYNITERAIWSVINGLGWWWWGSIAVLAAWNLFGMFKLAPAGTPFGRAIRYVLMVGFVLLSLSPGNTAFGPLAIPVILIGVRMWTHQLYADCVRYGKVKPFWPTLFGKARVAATPIPDPQRNGAD